MQETESSQANTESAAPGRAVVFRGKDLRGANLSGANLEGADLFFVDLQGANLSNARLYRAELSGANLRGANLSGADLLCANLSGATLTDAVLTDATLEDAIVSCYVEYDDDGNPEVIPADLCGADLSGCDLSGTNLEGARYSEETRWPDGFQPHEQGARLVSLAAVKTRHAQDLLSGLETPSLTDGTGTASAPTPESATGEGSEPKAEDGRPHEAINLAGSDLRGAVLGDAGVRRALAQAHRELRQAQAEIQFLRAELQRARMAEAQRLEELSWMRQRIDRADEQARDALAILARQEQQALPEPPGAPRKPWWRVWGS